MNVKSIHPMKPVLVTDVSDDINVLQKDDVTKQRTVLTARAIEDVFKCAPIVKTNESVAVHPDNAYFNAAGKIDLNTIVTAQSRRLESNTYVNGPENQSLTLKDNVSGNAAYAASHTASVYKPSGFLYVFSILDNNMLSWDNWDGVIPIQDELGPDSNGPETNEDISVRKVDPREPSECIRQIFVPTDFNEYLTADGTKFDPDAKVGSTPRNYRSRYNIGKQLTRVGRKQIINGQVTYQWEGWYDMSKTHDGPEYFTNIIVGNPTSAFYKKYGVETPETQSAALISSPLADAVYHIYCQVDEFRLPNANLDAFKVGQKIILEVHPPQGEVSSSVRVFYQDTTADGEVNIGNEQQVLITPRIRRNTKDVFGNVSDDAMVTSVACFEIVEVTENGQTFRTWELDAGVEETDFTAGIAQMVGEHTDRCSGDIVGYQSASMQDVSEITIKFPLTSAGFAIARLLKRDDTHTLTDESWKMWVEIIKANSEACFTKVNKNSDGLYPDPDPSKIYYVKEGVTWHLAEGTTAGKYDGRPSSLDHTLDYYYIDLTNCEKESIIRIKDEGSSSGYRTYVTLADLDWDKMRGFSGYGNRGDILSITISTTNTASYFRDKLFPLVMFCPDPHDSYIHKASINPSAFTYNQLKQLFLDGTTIDDIRLANSTELLEGLMNSPVSTRALIEAYTYLAQKLQQKGLLFGNNMQVNVTTAEMDRLVDGGFYYIVPKTLIDVEPGHYPPNIQMSGCNVVVITNKRAPSGMVHEEEGGIIEQDKAVQISVLAGDPTNPIGDMFYIYTRIGVKDDPVTNHWTWSTWRTINDWRNIDNKPLYFRSRWDYMEDPNGFVDGTNHIDFRVVEGQNASIANGTGYLHVHQNDGVTDYISYHHYINVDQVKALLDTVNTVDEATLQETVDGVTSVNLAEELDLQYSTFKNRADISKPVNYRVPTFIVGLRNLRVSSVPGLEGGKQSGINYYYFVDVCLPRAQYLSNLTDKERQRRRKIRILLVGSDKSVGGYDAWDKLIVRVHYANPQTSSSDPEWVAYSSSPFRYERTWGSLIDTNESMIDIEFEQVDLPSIIGTDSAPARVSNMRIWSPIEIG